MNIFIDFFDYNNFNLNNFLHLYMSVLFMIFIYRNISEKNSNQKQKEEKRKQEKEQQEQQEQKEKEQQEKEKEQQQIVKYEDKYLDKYINFTNDISIPEEYFKLEKEKYEELLSFCLEKKENELKLLENEKNEISNYILQFNEQKDHDTLKEIQNKLEVLQEFQPDLNEIRKEANEYISNKVFDNLVNSYIFEKTPLGNVAMCFNNKKGSFEYYSDNTIPYRFLETVARKYVITFHCKKLYVDMNEELNNAKLKQIKEKDQKEKEEQTKDTILKTKDVFARLKNYSNNNNNYSNNSNNNSNNSNSNFIRQRNNNNNNNNNNNYNTNQKGGNMLMILKENANRYTHNGKFANFIMLKKVDKKVVDKNYSLNYKDFAKKMIERKL